MGHLPVVVYDLDLIGTLIGPDEADPILVVDPDAVLPSTVARERFQSIPGRNAEIVEPHNRVEILELALGDPPERRGARPPGGLRPLAIEDVLCPLPTETPDHIDTIAGMSCYVKARGITSSGSAASAPRTSRP
jgi:hypothetical protein